MNNYTTTQGMSTLGIRIVGTGEYVTNQLLHLQGFFDFIEKDRLEDIKQENE